MSKRPCPDDDTAQPVKKQHITKTKSRKILSSSSERALQLLYEGAAKYEKHGENKKENSKVPCFVCSQLGWQVNSCSYCEHEVCLECINICYKCMDAFCCKCIFLTYDENEAVCYSCYTV